MSKDSYLFLLGGNPSQSEAASMFVQAAGGTEAKIALLLIHHENWEADVPRYTDNWVEAGVSPNNISVIIPDKDGKINEETKAVFEAATGIFVGGGHTETYYDTYVKTPFKEIIKHKHDSGIPVAGNSAGALILPETVLFSPRDTDSRQQWVGSGIGLVKDTLISVHYTKWQEKHNLAIALKKTGTPTGYGIDDEACLVFKNGQYFKVLGKEKVHKIRV